MGFNTLRPQFSNSGQKGRSQDPPPPPRRKSQTAARKESSHGASGTGDEELWQSWGWQVGLWAPVSLNIATENHYVITRSLCKGCYAICQSIITIRHRPLESQSSSTQCHLYMAYSPLPIIHCPARETSLTWLTQGLSWRMWALSHIQGATFNYLHRGAGTGRGTATTSPRCWEGQGSSPLEQTTPASFSCPQRLTIQPRDLQLASEDSVPVHSTSSSMIGPFPVGTKGKPGATLEEEPDLQWGPSAGTGAAHWLRRGCLRNITQGPQPHLTQRQLCPVLGWHSHSPGPGRRRGHPKGSRGCHTLSPTGLCRRSPRGPHWLRPR